MKFLSLAVFLTFSASALAQVYPMAEKEIKKNFYYARISASESKPVEWAATWTPDKKFVLYQVEKNDLKLMASYAVEPKFYNIEAGLYMLQINGINRPLFLFVLNHGAPKTTLYVFDPKDTYKHKVAVDVPTDEFDLSLSGRNIQVVYSAGSRRKRISIDTLKLGIK